jgi:hypothetical protein
MPTWQGTCEAARLRGYRAAELLRRGGGVRACGAPRVLERARARLRTIYGITEVGAAVTMNPPGTPVTTAGDVGLPPWHSGTGWGIGIVMIQ